MKPHQLIEARTRDGLTLPGVLFEPVRRRRAAVIWVPGLGGPFTSHLERTNELARQLNVHGIAFGIFNTRGSYTVAHLKAKRGKKLKRIPAGVAFERFRDCILDLDAMVHEVKSLGYRKVFLAGHSTGANKVAYYLSHTGKKVAGAVLLGPVSDIPGLRKDFGKKFKRLLQVAKQLVRRGRGDELLPRSLAGSWFWSADRFVSIAAPKQAEDTFPYYDAGRKFPWVRNWRVPLMVVLSSRDEFLDRPTAAFQHAFNKQCAHLIDYQFQLIRGADHGFSEHHAELARCLTNWVKKKL